MGLFFLLFERQTDRQPVTTLKHVSMYDGACFFSPFFFFSTVLPCPLPGTRGTWGRRGSLVCTPSAFVCGGWGGGGREGRVCLFSFFPFNFLLQLNNICDHGIKSRLLQQPGRPEVLGVEAGMVFDVTTTQKQKHTKQPFF